MDVFPLHLFQGDNDGNFLANPRNTQSHLLQAHSDILVSDQQEHPSPFLLTEVSPPPQKSRQLAINNIKV